MNATKRRLRTCWPVVFSALAGAPLFAQPTGQPNSRQTNVQEVRPSPDELSKVLVYGVLFRQVAVWEQVAKRDSLQSVSHDSGEAVGLSGKKLKTFRAIALQCLAETERYGALISARARTEIAAGSTSPTPELQQLKHDSDEVVVLAIDEIREALGNELFEKTDRRIRAYIGPRIHTFAPTRVGASQK